MALRIRAANLWLTRSGMGCRFLCVRAGGTGRGVRTGGELRTLELRRSRGSVRMEKDLEFDTLFWRHGEAIRRELERFRPDVIHITGPSELGIFGAYFAWELGVPLVASWHTNVHEYAARRMGWLTGWLSERRGAAIESGVEAGALWATSQFYKLAKVLFAPNDELCRMLEKTTGRPCFLMQRGVDTEWFSPAHRTRRGDGPDCGAGVCGAAFGGEECGPAGAGGAGAGGDGGGWGAVSDRRPWQRGGVAARGVGDGRLCRRTARGGAGAGLRRYGCAGVSFAHGYVWQCGAGGAGDGVPAVVTPDGGPKFIVRDGETGFVAR